MSRLGSAIHEAAQRIWQTALWYVDCFGVREMTAVYSGGALEGVLKVVVSLGGDRLELRTGQIPSAFVGTRPLRLTLPATSSSMLQALCAEMGAAHQARGGAGESRFSYALASGAEFEVKIRGSLSEPGTASILVRLNSDVLAPASTQPGNSASTPER